MKITMSSTALSLSSRVQGVGKQVAFATAVALTRTAKAVREEIKADMQQSFDKPTKYTLNSLFVKGATKNKLEARVWLKDAGGKGTPADRYLAPQIEGGVRRLKALETMLQRGGLMRSGEFAVPAAGAQIDANGNVKRSQIVQILSQLKLQRTSGFDSKATGSARSNRSIAKQGVTYFAISAAQRGLQPGIYLKRKFALGSAIRPVFIFVPKATYRIRLKFFETGNTVAKDLLPRYIDEEMKKAMASARLGGRR